MRNEMWGYSEVQYALCKIKSTIRAIRMDVRLMGELLANEVIENGVESEYRELEKKYRTLWSRVTESEYNIAWYIDTRPEQDLVWKLGYLGIKTPETYEDIMRRWKQKPDLPEQGTADATRVKIDGYRNWADDFFKFVGHCEYWEGVKGRMLALAGIAETLVRRTSIYARRLYLIDIHATIKIINMKNVDEGLARGNYHNINEEERSWLENVHTLITDIGRAAEALVNQEGEGDTTELRDKILKLHGLVTQIEEAHKHTPLVKGVSQTQTQGGGRGGGGGAEAEAERRVLALQDVYKEWRELYEAIGGEATPLDDTGKDHGERQKAMHESLLEWAGGMVSTAPSCDNLFQIFVTTGNRRWQALGELYVLAYGKEKGDENLNNLKKIIRNSIGDQTTGDPTSELIEGLNTLGEQLGKIQGEQSDQEKERKGM